MGCRRAALWPEEARALIARLLTYRVMPASMMSPAPSSLSVNSSCE